MIKCLFLLIFLSFVVASGTLSSSWIFTTPFMTTFGPTTSIEQTVGTFVMTSVTTDQSLTASETNDASSFISLTSTTSQVDLSISNPNLQNTESLSTPSTTAVEATLSPMKPSASPTPSAKMSAANSQRSITAASSKIQRTSIKITPSFSTTWNVASARSQFSDSTPNLNLQNTESSSASITTVPDIELTSIRPSLSSIPSTELFTVNSQPGFTAASSKVQGTSFWITPSWSMVTATLQPAMSIYSTGSYSPWGSIWGTASVYYDTKGNDSSCLIRCGSVWLVLVVCCMCYLA